MEIVIFLARFWGSLFMILGAMSIGAKLLGRIIEYAEDRTITISTGYITFLLGLATVVAHNVWVADWRVAVTILGWVTLFKGIEKVGFQGEAFDERVLKQIIDLRLKYPELIISVDGAVNEETAPKLLEAGANRPDKYHGP